MRKFYLLLRVNFTLFFLLTILCKGIGQTNTNKTVNPTTLKEASKTKTVINERKTVNPTLPKSNLSSMSATPKPAPEKGQCEAVLPSIPFAAAKTVNPTQLKTVNPTLPKGTNTTLTADAINKLQKAGAIIKENPSCNVKVESHAGATKVEQQLSWERANVVVRYLVEKAGISEKRIIFNYGADGNINIVDLHLTNESGPYTVPQPYPNLRSN